MMCSRFFAARASIWVAVVSLGLLLGSSFTPAVAQPAPVPVPNEDAVMAAAIAKAQASLPRFFEILAKPQPGDDGFAVKIHYNLGSGGGEHIWANDVQRNGNEVTATINNRPQKIPNLKLGQRVTVPMERITDWMFFRDDKI